MELNDKNLRKMIRMTLMYQTNSNQCICETLRLIYDEVADITDGRRERVLENLIDAMIMAKKMSDRLDFYYKTYVDKTGHGGKKLVRLQNYDKKLAMRRTRKL